MKLRKFQQEFIANVLRPDINMAALSLPRGNGKSALAGHLGARLMTPGDPLFRPGTESIIVAGSLEQARIIFRFVRDDIGQDNPDYRFADSLTRVQIIHKPTRTVLQVRSSNPKTTMGLVNTPWVIADEPGAWAVNDGALMFDAISTSLGKPNSPLKALFLGTLAPATGGWWHDLIAKGSHHSTYVQAIQGDRETWDRWQTIRKANPLTAISPEFRKQLLEERDAARGDTRLKARFLSYRLNLPTADESEVLLTVEDFQLAAAREVAPATGQPIVGVDLGQNRSWTAAVAIWETGRIEAMAIAPGVPSLEEQEKRDTVPKGAYQKLHDMGVLDVAEGLRVPEPTHLWEDIKARWGIPAAIVCDRFRLPLLQDAVQGACYIDPRITRWSDAVFDIRSLQKGFKDGPFSVEESSRPLLIASLAAAFVKNDDQGNTRLSKRNSDQKARDDVAAALTLAAGGWGRATLGRREAAADETEVFIAR